MKPLRRVAASLLAAGLCAGAAQAQIPFPASSASDVPEAPAGRATSRPRPPQFVEPIGEPQPTFVPTAAQGDAAVAPGPIDLSASPLPDFAAPSYDGSADHRVWVSADALYWWMKNNPTPVLVTTGNPTDPVPGALGQPGTRPLFGGDGDGINGIPGARATVGLWLDYRQRFGAELSGFAIFQQSHTFNAASDAAGNPPIYLPIFRPEVNRQGSYIVSDPLGGGFGPLSGSVSVSNSIDLRGFEANGLLNFYRDSVNDFAIIAGFRALELNEQTSLVGVLNDDVFDIHTNFTDSFKTRNQFYGGQLGLRWNGRYLVGRHDITLGATAKAAIGSTDQVVNVNGVSIVNGTGAPNGTFAGGVYSQPSNIGRMAQSDFTFVPQVQLKLGYLLSQRLNVFAGYDVLYWSSVVRPGEQISRAVSVPLTPALGQPLPIPGQRFVRSDFFAHGVSCGIELKF